MMRCAITDGRFDPAAGADVRARLVARCARLATDGVDLLIVREKSLAAGVLVSLVREIVAVADEMRVLVAGGRVDVALAAGAAGVHLSAQPGELRVEQVRSLMAGAFVTVSCHTMEEVEAARNADAVLFGPVFGKVVRRQIVERGVGAGRLREACSVGVPVLALGRVDEESAGICVEAGAAGVAGIRMFFGE